MGAIFQLPEIFSSKSPKTGQEICAKHKIVVQMAIPVLTSISQNSKIALENPGIARLFTKSRGDNEGGTL